MSNSWERKFHQAEKRIKFAWRKYYESENDHLSTNTQQVNLLQQVITSEAAEELPLILVNELKEAMVVLKKEIECPICYETLNTETIKFAPCGHKYCKTCYEKIDTCAVCRRKLPK